MFKIVKRGSEYGSDPEQPRSSTKFEHLHKSAIKNSVIVKKISGTDGEKRNTKDLNKKTAPKNQTAPVTTSEPTDMGASIQLIDDELELLDSIKDFLCDANKKYTVVGAIGSQGTGKSTFLSMLAGNDTMDMYRQYIFRPCAREAVESCRYQTTKISIFIAPKTRVFFLDCQPLNCAPLLEDISHSYRSKAGPMESLELESLQFLLLLANVCHTIFLCIDWFIDMSIIRRLMRVELFTTFLNKSERGVNLIVLHQRVRQQDFHPLLVEERMRILNGIFSGTIFNINGGLTLSNLGFDVYQQIKSNENYIIIEEIKPRTRSDICLTDTFPQKTNSLEYSTVLNRLRTKFHSLPKRELASTEGKWFSFVIECWARIKLELPTITEDGCTIKWNYLNDQTEPSSRDFSVEGSETEDNIQINLGYMTKKKSVVRGQQKEWKNNQGKPWGKEFYKERYSRN